jgi:hypothetical protein
MLLCSGRVLLALGVVALAVVFRSGPVCLGSVLVVLRSLVVFVSCHGRFPFFFASQLASKAADKEWFLPNACKSTRRHSNRPA